MSDHQNNEHAPAVAYLRTDLPDCTRELDERRIRKLATRLGYDLVEIITVTGDDPARVILLLGAVARTNAEAVFTPDITHLDDQLERVIAVADVIVDAHQVHARWSPIAEIAGYPTMVEKHPPRTMP